MVQYVEYPKGLFDTRKADLQEQGPIAYAKRIFRDACPDCEYDPINKESQNIKCQTCGGSGFILETKFVHIPAVVNLAIYNDELMKAGVTTSDKCRILMDDRAWKDHRNYLTEKIRLYIDKRDIYEIENVNFYGPGRRFAVALNCRKVIEPTAGVD
jgi:hypothetical protein